CAGSYINNPLTLMVKMELVGQHQIGGSMVAGAKRHLWIDNDFVRYSFFWCMKGCSHIYLIPHFNRIVILSPFFVPVDFGHTTFFHRNVSCRAILFDDLVKGMAVKKIFGNIGFNTYFGF